MPHTLRNPWPSQQRTTAGNQQNMCLLVWFNLHGNQVIVPAEVRVGKLHSCVHWVHWWWPGVWRRGEGMIYTRRFGGVRV